ncbi:hypothetical protein RFI_25243, partial [Reticulomyxa filosa]
KLNVSQSPYVDPDDHDAAKDIIEGSTYISKCWKGGTKVVVVFGKRGSGKSLFCHKLREDDWSKYRNAESTSTPIPIIITLPKHYNPSEEENVIMNALELKIGKVEAEKLKNNKTPIRLFLDGFDEIYDNYKNSKHRQVLFFDRFKLDQWNAQVVITCRSDVLSEDHIRRMLLGYGSNTKIPISVIHLLPFSKQQKIEYIGKFLNGKNKHLKKKYWDEKRYEETLNKYLNLQMMAKEPYFLLILVTQLPQWPKDTFTNITRWQLIEAQCKDWVKNCSQRFCKVHNYNDNPRTADSIIKTKCQEVAIDMHQKKTSVLTIENESSKKTSVLTIENESSKKTSADRPDPTIDNDEKKDNTHTNSSTCLEKHFEHTMFSRSCLKDLGNYQYSFPHKLEHELQAAQYIAKQVDEAKLDGKETAEIEQFELNEELLDAPGILELLAERAGGYKFNGRDGNDTLSNNCSSSSTLPRTTHKSRTQQQMRSLYSIWEEYI